MKYTVITNDYTKIGNIDIGLTDVQIVAIFRSFDVDVFNCEYTDDFYFIEATEDQVEEIKGLDFVDGIEIYDETYFKVKNHIDWCVDELDSLSSINDSLEVNKVNYHNKIVEIQELLNKLIMFR